jgi:soluble lytic murein transglycosylase-like protein
MSRLRQETGQALVLLTFALAAALAGAFVLGAIARGVARHGHDQSVADISALAGAREMGSLYWRLFEPALLDDAPNPRHLARSVYLDRARREAIVTARANGARVVRVTFPDGGTLGPTRIRVEVADAIVVERGGRRRSVTAGVRAEAELVPAAAATLAGFADGGGYHGPLAYRQGKPMRPDVALAFDRLAAAARAAGLALVVVSGYRSDAEQAELFRRHPDPRWVAKPGHSLHRLGTELDLGPRSAWPWLARNAQRFGFVRRYSWEPWHFGLARNAGSASVGFGGAADGRSAIPAWVPARLEPALAHASSRWSVSAALLAAQLYAESGFNPFAVSPAGARGIAQFMPDTARAYGLRDPYDTAAAIDAQAHLMRDLLARFASVPLALAAYNAGPVRVARCGCIPPIPETRSYVARILGLLHGMGDFAAGQAALQVRLIA